MVAARRSTACGCIIAAAAVPFALRQILQATFVGSRGALRHVAVQRKAATYEDEFPNLARVEGMIHDSCMVKDGEAELKCLSMWDKLSKFHQTTKNECHLDNLRCIVLDVLDRLCTGIDSGDGLVLLNRVSNVVTTLKDQFTNWDKAFAHYDTDRSGDISEKEMFDMLRKMNVGLTEKESAICFFAADANGDGKVTPQEFSDFMTAAVFAEETLKEIEADPVPKKLKSTEDFLSWALKDREDMSWGSSLR
eukprot:TRINITY_DN1611_c0_g1_i1.p1 TRINITY_DN1611_c0_g1~~TRINITY_DN1611_c0_g1_i1.p1  ORF type:complete len:250 (-),score=95.65 TRINITY_DN1611_c0_g1_i1:470-1219(-)